jgi:hypothetical protein
VEEVLRANKEAQTAAKREKQIQNQLLQQQQQQQQLLLQQQQQQQQSQHSSQNNHSHSHIISGSSSSSNSNSSNIHTVSNSTAMNVSIASSSYAALASASTSTSVPVTGSEMVNAMYEAMNNNDTSTSIDGPKDRSVLANLRVIRRNLIYAVGLPPTIANEETLRRPEYFGQYGKLTKVVVNRSSLGGDSSDPRRASSSAYITFQFKEDTLACILALDGFHLEHRTIRASYGTSKYCSAFMKHVRCSNPDCTYLHEMGAAEDTFTKQEIQAGYVTSGCDVIARQQQILLEQQNLNGGPASGNKSSSRKRVGGGGPSGTGKPHPNPTFPAPEFEDPARQALPPSIPAMSTIGKASTLGTSSSVTTQPLSYINATNVPAKLGRTTSASVLPGGSTAPGAGLNPPRKANSGIVVPSVNSTTATTAASVVANTRRVTAAKEGTDAQQHLSLTALTPLKRTPATKNPPAKVLPVVSEDDSTSTNKVPATRNGKKQQSNSTRATNLTNIHKSAAPLSTLSELQHSNDVIIGGDVIASSLNGWNANKPLNFGSAVTTSNTIGSNSSNSSLAELGGIPIPIPSTASKSTILGGEIYTGPLLKQSHTSLGGGSNLFGGSSLNDYSQHYGRDQSSGAHRLMVSEVATTILVLLDHIYQTVMVAIAVPPWRPFWA